MALFAWKIGGFVAVSLLPCSLSAQQDSGEGRSLMERGAELFFEGLRQEMEPALRDLQGLAEQAGPSLRSFLVEMGPALADLAEQIGDWSEYHAPEILPNGDILIRRRDPVAPQDDTEDGGVDAETKPDSTDI